MGMYPNIMNSIRFKKTKKNFKGENDEKANITKEKEEQKEKDQNILNKHENI